MRLKSMITAATACALAAGAAGAVADGGGNGRADGKGNDPAFATVKDGTSLTTFGARKARTVPIQGLAAGETVVGIDVRPATGALYGVSSAGRVFTIDPRTGDTANSQTLTAPLSGTGFGVDFNPSVDRLRVVSDAEQNLRINVDTGATTVDGPLAFPAGDRNAGRDPNVTAVAYTFAPLTTPASPTALYDIATGPDTFTLQNPPNGGGLQSIGPLGVDVGTQAGYDIAGTRTFTGYVLVQQGGSATVYESRFDRNGSLDPTGIQLNGSYDGLAVLAD